MTSLSPLQPTNKITQGFTSDSFVCGGHRLGHESLSILLASASQNPKCSRPRLGDKHSLRSSCIPPAAFKSSPANKQNRPRVYLRLICLWWAGEDLNLHALRHQLLRLACLPISPPAHLDVNMACPLHVHPYAKLAGWTLVILPVHPVGVEPTTNSLRGSCSTN